MLQGQSDGGMKVIRLAGVDSRMNYFGRSSTPTNDTSLPIVRDR